MSETTKPIFTPEQTAQIRESVRIINAETARILEMAFKPMMAAMAPTARAMGEALQKLDDAAKADYEAAGAPYGDSMEGRWRWMNEMADAANARRREINAVQREKDLADMRALGEQVGKRLAKGARQTDERILAD